MTTITPVKVTSKHASLFRDATDGSGSLHLTYGKLRTSMTENSSEPDVCRCWTAPADISDNQANYQPGERPVTLHVAFFPLAHSFQL
jgi:hypothetical protein